MKMKKKQMKKKKSEKWKESFEDDLQVLFIISNTLKIHTYAKNQIN